MPRNYLVSFEGVTVTAAQDMVYILGATAKMCKIKRIWWYNTDTTLSTAQMVQTRCRYLPATVTPGSAGGAFTPVKLDQGDPASTFTARINDTVKATTSGTAVILEEFGNHIYAGLDYELPRPITIPVSTAFVWELLSTVSGTVHLSGGVEVSEEG